MSDSWLPPPPESPARGTGTGSTPAAAADLSPDLQAQVRRVRWWLLLVPFSFPMWFRLRSEHPEAAERLRFALAVCVFNSVLALLLGCCMVSLLVFRQQIIDALVPIVVDSGLVR